MAELYEVVLTQTYYNQRCINRWNYLFSGTPGVSLPSFILARGLGAIESAGTYPTDKLMRKIAACQVGAVTFQQLTVLNVFDPVDFYQVPFVSPLTGDAASSGEGNSPVLAAGFRTNQIRRDVARGTKRFVGIGEGYIQAGGAVVATSGVFFDLAGAMSANVVEDDEGTSLTFIPCVAGKQRYNPETGLPSDTGSAYRYFPEADQFDHVAAGVTWQAYDTIRTQTSRQYGRGR